MEGGVLRGRANVAWKGKRCVQGGAASLQRKRRGGWQSPYIATHHWSSRRKWCRDSLDPSASRYAHDPAIANLIQRASSFPYNEARVLVLTERRRIETSGRRLCEPPYDPASCPTLQDRFRRTRYRQTEAKGSRQTNARFSSMKETLCVMAGYDAPIGRFSP